VGKTFSRVSSCVVVGMLVVGCVEQTPDLDATGQKSFVEEFFDEIPNNLWFPNERGFAATSASAGFVDLDNSFFTPLGTNGRHCGTCHSPEVGWSMTPAMVTALFLVTDGTHPLFVNNKDTDTPTSDMSTVEARWSSTTMLRQGKFTRKIGLPATRDYDLVAIDDPWGVSTPASLFFFRRPQPTANLRSFNVHADNAMTVGIDLREGLMKQVRASTVAALEGAGPPAETIVGEIADYEMQLGYAQTYIWGAGRLDADGARGGADHALAQPLVAGRFDLYDAWQNSPNSYRRQIWRGQEIFNNVNAPSGRRCGGCHNAANNGQNVNGTLFNIGASNPALARPDMAVFTFQSRADGSIVQSTDPGQGLRNGLFASLNKFKTPSLRGLVARPPFFHGGTAQTLLEVVRHYESALGFVFTAEEEADLVAFLNAL
jgi:cytochrome c peroxidase